jgi:hypothetical protein
LNFVTALAPLDALQQSVHGRSGELGRPRAEHRSWDSSAVLLPRRQVKRAAGAMAGEDGHFRFAVALWQTVRACDEPR